MVNMPYHELHWGEHGGRIFNGGAHPWNRPWDTTDSGTYQRSECRRDKRRQVSSSHVYVDEVLSVDAVKYSPDSTDDSRSGLVSGRVAHVKHGRSALPIPPAPLSHVRHQAEYGTNFREFHSIRPRHELVQPDRLAAENILLTRGILSAYS